MDIDDDPPETIATVVLHRHGQGQHNVQGLHLMDPPLTAQGLQEARDIGMQYCRGELPRPQLVIVSPLQRTLMTATTAMNTMMEEDKDDNNLEQRQQQQHQQEQQQQTQLPKMIATDLCREINNLNACNYRCSIPRLEFPVVDFFVQSETGDDGHNGHEYRPKLKDQVQVLQQRARRFLQFLQLQVIALQQPQGAVVRVSVFTHASFLRSLSCVVLGLNAHHGVPPLPTGGTMRIALRRQAANDCYWVLADDCQVIVSQLPHIITRPKPPANQQGETEGKDSPKGKQEVG